MIKSKEKLHELDERWHKRHREAAQAEEEKTNKCIENWLR